MAEPAPEERFEPRLRRDVFLRRLFAREGRHGGWNLLAALAFASTIFCFVQVFRALGSVTPGGGNPVNAGGLGSMWFLFGAFSAGLLGVALDHRVEQKASLKAGALRELALDAWRRLRAR